MIFPSIEASLLSTITALTIGCLLANEAILHTESIITRGYFNAVNFVTPEQDRKLPAKIQLFTERFFVTKRSQSLYYKPLASRE